MATKNRLRRLRNVVLSPFLGVAKGFVEAGKKVWAVGEKAYNAAEGGKIGIVAGIAAGVGALIPAAGWFVDGAVDGTIDCAANGPGKAWENIPFDDDLEPDIPLKKAVTKILAPVGIGLVRGAVEAGKKVAAVARMASTAAGGGKWGKFVGFWAGVGALIPAADWFVDGFINGAADCVANGFKKALENIPFDEDLEPNVPKTLSMLAGAGMGIYGASEYHLRESWKACFREDDHPFRRGWAFLLATVFGWPTAMTQGAIQGASRGTEGWQAAIESRKHFSKVGVGGIARVGTTIAGMGEGAVEGFYAYKSRFGKKITEWIGGEDVWLVQALVAGIAAVGGALMVPYSTIMGGVQGSQGVKKLGFAGHLEETGFQSPHETVESKVVQRYEHRKDYVLDTDTNRYDPHTPVPPYVRPDVSSLAAYRAAQVASGAPIPAAPGALEAQFLAERSKQRDEKMAREKLGPGHIRKQIMGG